MLKVTRKIAPTITTTPPSDKKIPGVVPRIGDNADMAEKIVMISS
jgi:hypothetical protein